MSVRRPIAPPAHEHEYRAKGPWDQAEQIQPDQFQHQAAKQEPGADTSQAGDLAQIGVAALLAPGLTPSFQFLGVCVRAPEAEFREARDTLARRRRRKGRGLAAAE